MNPADIYLFKVNNGTSEQFVKVYILRSPSMEPA